LVEPKVKELTSSPIADELKFAVLDQITLIMVQYTTTMLQLGGGTTPRVEGYHACKMSSSVGVGYYCPFEASLRYLLPYHTILLR
jgi:hypothetical protein